MNTGKTTNAIFLSCLIVWLKHLKEGFPKPFSVERTKECDSELIAFSRLLITDLMRRVHRTAPEWGYG